MRPAVHYVWSKNATQMTTQAEERANTSQRMFDDHPQNKWFTANQTMGRGSVVVRNFLTRMFWNATLSGLRLALILWNKPELDKHGTVEKKVTEYVAAREWHHVIPSVCVFTCNKCNRPCRSEACLATHLGVGEANLFERHSPSLCRTKNKIVHFL